jgi:hypothetical protein
MSKIQTMRNPFKDFSLWLLLFSNTVTIFIAMKEDWNILTVLWVYWFQNITIGFFHFVKLLRLQKLSKNESRIDDQPSRLIKNKMDDTALFSLGIYGVFHLIYMLFLIAGSASNAYGMVLLELKYIFLAALVFFINHLLSYLYNRPKDAGEKVIGDPFVRVFPMQFTLIFGLVVDALPLILGLKTISDATMHAVEHRAHRNSNEEEVG